MSAGTKRRILPRIVLILAPAAAITLLAGCNTIEGVGQDLAFIGRGMSDVAGGAGDAMTPDEQVGEDYEVARFQYEPIEFTPQDQQRQVRGPEFEPQVRTQQDQPFGVQQEER